MIDGDLAHCERRTIGRALDAKEPRLRPVDLIARLRVVERLELRLKAVLRRSLDDVHWMPLPAPYLHGDDRVLTGRDPMPAEVAVGIAAIARAEELAPLRADHEVRTILRDLDPRRLHPRVIALRLLLAIDLVDRLRLPRDRRRALNRDRLLDVRRNDEPERLTARGPQHPRVTSVGLLPALAPRLDPSVGPLRPAAVDPYDLNGFIQPVCEAKPARRSVPPAAPSLRRQPKFERARVGRVAHARRTTGEIEHERLVAPLYGHDHARALDGDLARWRGKRRMIEERHPRCSALLPRIDKPPAPRSTRQRLAIPQPRPIDPRPRSHGIAIELHLRIDARPCSAHPRAHLLEGDAV